MIDKQTELQDNLEILKEEYRIIYGDNLPEQIRIMDSGKFNTSLKEVERALNVLYEKARALENSIGYAREFLGEETKRRGQQIEYRIKEIEETRDAMKADGYKAHPISITRKSISVVRDRDGSVLPSCGISRGQLTLSGQVLEDIPVKDFSKKTAMRDEGVFNQLGEVSRYQTKYRTEMPVPGGITEEISFYFKGVRELSGIDIVPSNCEIVETAFINENDAEEILPQSKVFRFPSVAAKGIRLTLLAKNHESISVVAKEPSRSPWGEKENEMVYLPGSVSPEKALIRAKENRARNIYATFSVKMQEHLDYVKKAKEMEVMKNDLK